MLRLAFAQRLPATYVLLAPTKSGVLQNVGHTSVIWWVRLEPNGEDIVLVVPRNMKVLCPSLIML